MASNLEQTRSNMIEQQIRPWNVLDPRILELLKKVKREQFVPSSSQALALMDIEIPLGHGASMWTPMLEARVLQSLNLKSSDTVLEVGSGSGYLTALLARLSAKVTSVELVPELHALASKNLAAHHIGNVALVQGDAAQGWPGQFDVIVLTGSVPVLPQAFQDSLKPGGRLFALVGEAPVMEALLITKDADGKVRRTTQFEACIAPLQHAMSPERFAF